MTSFVLPDSCYHICSTILEDINILFKRGFKGKYLNTFAGIFFLLLLVALIVPFLFAFHLDTLHLLQKYNMQSFKYALILV